MSVLLYVSGFILFVLAIIIILIYNNLVEILNLVKQSWSGIDVQLQRRTDLIPNLVRTVEGYVKHEKNVLEAVTQARVSLIDAKDEAKPRKAAIADNNLSKNLKSLFAVSENYPDLKANKNFLKLQKQLSETEDQIAASRRIYNENVAYFNIKAQSFPINIIASMFNFEKQDFFEVKKRKNVEVNT